MTRRYSIVRGGGTRFRVDYAAALNEQQLAVVEAGDGPLLVIAGAGSGKTRTLTYRVARLIELGADPREILLLTFTNRAAREMLRRIEGLIKTDTRRLWGGTFHSVGNRLLRQHAESLGYRGNFGILDQEDARETMEAAASASGAPGPRGVRFPRGDVLAEIHSFCLNTGMELGVVLAERYPHFETFAEAMRRVFAAYRERKRAANVMDYDDLLLNWRALLEVAPDVARALGGRFRYLLVDEYQDTNLLQGDIVDRMAGERRNVMVVGDDAQSIYSFRGASFANIIEFPKRYPDCQTFKLEVNYRSTPEVLDFANAVISKNHVRFEKQLEAVRPSGAPVVLAAARDVFEQADFVAQRLLELRDEGASFNDAAVLYRSHYQSMELQMELTRRGIPYEIRSGVRFFEARHIKDVLAFLRLLENGRDELSWKRVLKLFPRIGERTATAVWRALEASSDPLRELSSSAIDALMPRGAGASLTALRDLLVRLALPAMRRAPAEAIRTVVAECYGDQARAKFANAGARLDDLEQLAQFALGYEETRVFLDEISLLNTLAGEEVAVAPADDEKVTLSSVHQAKGLEWRHVFVIWLAEGHFPSSRSLREAGGEEEERRLFYVAATRAKDELYLTYPRLRRDQYSFDVLVEPSRFLGEAPQEALDRWELSSEAGEPEQGEPKRLEE